MGEWIRWVASWAGFLGLLVFLVICGLTIVSRRVRHWVSCSKRETLRHVTKDRVYLTCAECEIPVGKGWCFHGENTNGHGSSLDHIRGAWRRRGGVFLDSPRAWPRLHRLSSGGDCE